MAWSYHQLQKLERGKIVRARLQCAQSERAYGIEYDVSWRISIFVRVKLQELVFYCFVRTQWHIRFICVATHGS